MTLFTFHVTCPHCAERNRINEEHLPAFVTAPCHGDYGCGETSHYYLDETGARVLSDEEYRALDPLQREILQAANV